MVTPDGTTFSEIFADLCRRMKFAPTADNQRWQGIDVSRNPSAKMSELRNVVFELDLGGDENLDRWRTDCVPNLPWADDHFLERIGGEPLNPGIQWANWPWASSADRHRGPDERFNHTYMERLWPRLARGRTEPIQGIAGGYGDLSSLTDLLIRDPFTRQAWIPLFFPEDTGWGDGGRKPCTLGYQFIRRGNLFHVWYPLRSCDLVRHFRDDCYLAVRLLLWVLDQCRQRDSSWASVRPGTYGMHMTSLHCFVNDVRTLIGSLS